jgi:hypothetical protein
VDVARLHKIAIGIRKIAIEAAARNVMDACQISTAAVTAAGDVG